MDFWSDIRRRITHMITATAPSSFGDSVLIQLYNAVAALFTFTHTTHEDEM